MTSNLAYVDVSSQGHKGWISQGHTSIYRLAHRPGLLPRRHWHAALVFPNRNEAEGQLRENTPAVLSLLVLRLSPAGLEERY